MPRLHLIHVARIQVVSTCIICVACRRLHCVQYRRQKLPLRRHVSTCIRIQVARPGYLYPATYVSGVNAALAYNNKAYFLRSYSED